MYSIDFHLKRSLSEFGACVYPSVQNVSILLRPKLYGAKNYCIETQCQEVVLNLIIFYLFIYLKGGKYLQKDQKVCFHVVEKGQSSAILRILLKMVAMVTSQTLLRFYFIA